MKGGTGENDLLLRLDGEGVIIETTSTLRSECGMLSEDPTGEAVYDALEGFDRDLWDRISTSIHRGECLLFDLDLGDRRPLRVGASMDHEGNYVLHREDVLPNGAMRRAGVGYWLCERLGEVWTLTLSEWLTESLIPGGPKVVSLDHLLSTVDPEAKGGLRNLLMDIDGNEPPVVVRTDDGTGDSRWLRFTSEGGHPIRGVAMDITETVNALHELDRNSERLRLATEWDGLGFFEVDLITGDLSIDRMIMDIVGIRSDTENVPLERFLESMAGCNRDLAFELMEEMSSGKTDRLELSIELERESPLCVQIIGRVIHRSKESLKVLGCIRDITSSLEDRRKLQFSQERLRLALSGGDLAFWDWDLSSKKAYYDGSWARMLGFEIPELKAVSPDGLGVMHPEDQESFWTMMRDHYEGRSPSFSAEFRMLAKDGSYRWINARGKVAERDADGRPLRMVGVNHDITDVRNEELNRKYSEHMFQTLVENAHIGVNIATDGKIVYANPWMCDTLGIMEKEVLGQPIAKFIHPSEQAKVLHYHFRRLEGDRDLPTSYTIHILGSNDEVFPCNLNTVVVDWKGKPATMNFIMDLTEQIRSENDLRKALDEKTTLLKEVHHRVKNNLQLINAMISMQLIPVKRVEERRPLEDVCNRIQSIAKVHESLYQRGDMSSIAAESHLQTLMEDIARTSCNGCRITVEMRPTDIYIDLDQAVPISLVVNEILTNSIKHAFPDGREGRIWAGIEQLEDGGILFEIGDDGVGMSEEVLKNMNGTLGIKLIDVLVTRQLQGSYDILRDGGTRYLIRLPPDGFLHMCPV